ncbi:RnfH family protein [Thiomicrospira sp. ALE5]|uniref:RnfH family protein n=1 Tax=Thiomicrospira sp. ALE5 TaxID=748650 RepID=UPI0008F06625|nr:RnfH family protein [Thiomicrospira sp. ALE5]SFR51450.1 hypothetical protein SAMN03092900_0516 [Thiomicrospira sp. ALE5]
MANLDNSDVAHSDTNSDWIVVEVAYALPDKQSLYSLRVPLNTTAIDAVKLSPLQADYPEAVLDKLGIFSRPVSQDTLLRDGDRVEVYRPLKVDPKERRRKAAAQ